MKALLIQPDAFSRKGLQDFLQDFFAEVNAVGTLEEALTDLSAGGYDYIIVDLPFPEVKKLVNWFEQATMVRKLFVYTLEANVTYFAEAMELNMAGYFLKNRTVEEFKLALVQLRNGGRYFDSGLLFQYLEQVQEVEQSLRTREALNFTKREKEVLSLLAEGSSNEEIAAALFISRPTIQNHKRKLLDKTGVDTVKKLMVWAEKNRLLWEDLPKD